MTLTTTACIGALPWSRATNGYWVRLEGGSGGRATVVFESEDAARAAAGQFQPAPGGAATIDSIDAGEVVAHA